MTLDRFLLLVIALMCLLLLFGVRVHSEVLQGTGLILTYPDGRQAVVVTPLVDHSVSFQMLDGCGRSTVNILAGAESFKFSGGCQPAGPMIDIEMTPTSWRVAINDPMKPGVLQEYSRIIFDREHGMQVADEFGRLIWQAPRK